MILSRFRTYFVMSIVLISTAHAQEDDDFENKMLEKPSSTRINFIFYDKK